jgi:hypothetical protein
VLASSHVRDAAFSLMMIPSLLEPVTSPDSSLEERARRNHAESLY